MTDFSSQAALIREAAQGDLSAISRLRAPR